MTDSTPEADLSKVRTVPIERRPNKVRTEEFASPPGADRSFSAFIKALPDVLVAADFRTVVNAIVSAHHNSRAVVVTRSRDSERRQKMLRVDSSTARSEWRTKLAGE